MIGTDVLVDLGPLPEADDNSALQETSLRALHALLLNQSAILLRDERVNDYGVDGSFELRVDGRMTNFRSQVQLKGTTHVRTKQAGGVSLAVRTANLNYLLNGTCPIYLLFDAVKSEFWYAWAQDESRRLEAADSAWKEQKYVTLDFDRPLTAVGLGDIVQRVMREGRMHRQIHDVLARATTDDAVIIRIDADSLRITDPVEAQHVLLASGPTIIAAGFPSEALRMLDLVNPAVKRLPRLQLIAGYAEYTLGKHFNALGHIRQAMAGLQQLSDREKNFLAGLKDACEFRVGIIDVATYLQRSEVRAGSLKGLESLHPRLEAAYYRFITERDRRLRQAKGEEVRGIAAEILSHPQATDPFKLHARLLTLYIDGSSATAALAHQLGLHWMRERMQVTGTVRTMQNHQLAAAHLDTWESSAKAALNDANKLGHPLLITEACMVWLTIQIGLLMNRRIDSLVREKPFEIPQRAVTNVEQVLESAFSMAERAGNVEGRLRLEILKADLLEIVGDLPNAKALATRIHPEADAMAFADIAQRAKELIDNKTLLMEFAREDARLRQSDDDFWFAEMSDESLWTFANDALQALGLPSGRLKVMEQYSLTLREAARERCHWCRHLEVLDNRAQTDNPEIAFTVLPNRSCRCEKFGYQTEIVTSDAHALIGVFKEVHCARCTERSPKLP